MSGEMQSRGWQGPSPYQGPSPLKIVQDQQEAGPRASSPEKSKLLQQNSRFPRAKQLSQDDSSNTHHPSWTVSDVSWAELNFPTTISGDPVPLCR